MVCWLIFSTGISPANATVDRLPKPNAYEWWFTTWELTTKVWPVSTGRGEIVAVLDAGVNASIPDLAGVVLPGGDTTGGHSDGRHDADATDGGHGTAMATLIAGQGRNASMDGIAPDAKILPVKVMNNDKYASINVQSAIAYAVKHDARVISMSFEARALNTHQCDSSTQEAVDNALRHDVVLVASAGNQEGGLNVPVQPASCPGVLAVGAVDYKFRPWDRTQRQPYVSVAAPGVDTVVVGRDGRLNATRGTSVSAALTAGTVALVRAKFPKMPARQVVQRIIASCRDTGRPGRDDQTGYGLVRPMHALNDTVPANAPNPVYAAWDKYRSAASPGTGSSPPTKATGRAQRKAATGMGGALTLALVSAGVVFVLVGAGLFWRRQRGRL